MKIQETSSNAPSTVENDTKTPIENRSSEPDSSKSPKRKYSILTKPAILAIQM